nr:hypothetical protein [Lachnospiraceae bacterium]
FNGMSDYSNTRGRFFDRFFSDYRPDKHILVTEKKRTAGLYAEGEEEEAAEAKDEKDNKES